MNTDKKLYEIIDTTEWKPGGHFHPRRPELYPIVKDGHGNKYINKLPSRLSRSREMIVTKACKVANFDAVDNHFGYNKDKKLATLISPKLPYEIEPLEPHLLPLYKDKDKQTTNTNLRELIAHHPHFNDKFKSRLVDEFLLRMLFNDKDSCFSRNISVKCTENKHMSFYSNSLTAVHSPELELTASYDFNSCLTEDEDANLNRNSTARKNLEFIRKHYPQNAEKFFADFLFDNATLDELFDMTGTPREWLVLAGQIPTFKGDRDHRQYTELLSVSARHQFKQNLSFMKGGKAKWKTNFTKLLTSLNGNEK